MKISSPREPNQLETQFSRGSEQTGLDRRFHAAAMAKTETANFVSLIRCINQSQPHCLTSRYAPALSSCASM
jgi:hypothetical protein